MLERRGTTLAAGTCHSRAVGVNVSLMNLPQPPVDKTELCVDTRQPDSTPSCLLFRLLFSSLSWPRGLCFLAVVQKLQCLNSVVSRADGNVY